MTAVRGRMRVLAPAIVAGAVVIAIVAIAGVLVAAPLARWLDADAREPLWGTVVVAAAIATTTLGGASAWHGLVLTRLVRVRLVDRLIAALGVGMLLLAAGIVAAVGIEPALARAALLLASPLWAAGLGFAVLVGAMLLHARAPLHEPPGAVLILGAGLRGRDVGPLLRRRVERGAEVWRAALPGRPDARIVVAGGRGPDEVRTEASAMAEHLTERLGVPPGAIDLEQASTSTRENLELSRPFLTGERAPLAVVTSGYHAYRTAWLLAELGMDGAVVGAWTRPSYRPGAVVREALAIAADARRWCLAAALAIEAIAVWALVVEP
ncbi:YdcF family protein [Agrococcus sp. Marseille-Q4369]|uniref:YdcF family protein n=1 Tax=Agrococcus sp. Marseille-Q4369 TaxID=2810513 RepID=UPI001B8BFB8D|nr:YdcF family protein [Agrococcus sp. Marseille-Q4369]QUW19014.1 YdcF family protein [Agrococcus sp. Marseille-Q4369]